MRPALAIALALAGCSAAEPGVVRMDYRASAAFWDAPFPSDAKLTAAGTVDLSRYPNPGRIPLVEQGIALLESSAHGFGLGSGIFFRLDLDVDPSSLPHVADSRVPDRASVLLIDVDTGTLHPIEVSFAADGGPFGAPHWLAILPANGAPLAPARAYAAIVTTRVRDVTGAALPASDVVAALDAGDPIEGLDAAALSAHRRAIAAARAHGIDVDGIAGLTAFTTDDPRAGFIERLDTARQELVPAVRDLHFVEQHDDFCVFHGELTLPDHQSGELPYSEVGGTWTIDGAAAKQAPSRVVVTIPRAAAPSAAGYPIVVFVRTGGGGDRPLVDRGVRATNGGPPIEAGTGPARELARAGLAGLSLDGPHGGPRNVTHGDEQFLMFNFQNPGALRDNVRQSALELALMPQVIAGLEVDTASCAGAAPVARFDGARLALMGHSMGATIAPLVAWAAPEYGAMVLSGGGASWLMNLLYKKKPLEVRVLAEALLGYTDRGATLAPHDPVLSLVQWAIEPADPLVYAPDLASRADGPHVLMLQGIVDHYIMPPIANALSVSMALDQGGPSLDADVPELAPFVPLAGARAVSGAAAVGYPIRGAPRTTVVVQHPEDGVEDGHEVVFQTTAPKVQYRCFLADFARGRVPAVVDPSAGCAP